MNLGAGKTRLTILRPPSVASTLPIIALLLLIPMLLLLPLPAPLPLAGWGTLSCPSRTQPAPNWPVWAREHVQGDVAGLQGQRGAIPPHQPQSNCNAVLKCSQVPRGCWQDCSCLYDLRMSMGDVRSHHCFLFGVADAGWWAQKKGVFDISFQISSELLSIK